MSTAPAMVSSQIKGSKIGAPYRYVRDAGSKEMDMRDGWECVRSKSKTADSAWKFARVSTLLLSKFCTGCLPSILTTSPGPLKAKINLGLNINHGTLYFKQQRTIPIISNKKPRILETEPGHRSGTSVSKLPLLESPKCIPRLVGSFKVVEVMRTRFSIMFRKELLLIVSAHLSTSAWRYPIVRVLIAMPFVCLDKTWRTLSFCASQIHKMICISTGFGVSAVGPVGLGIVVIASAHAFSQAVAAIGSGSWHGSGPFSAATHLACSSNLCENADKASISWIEPGRHCKQPTWNGTYRNKFVLLVNIQNSFQPWGGVTLNSNPKTQCSKPPGNILTRMFSMWDRMIHCENREEFRPELGLVRSKGHQTKERHLKMWKPAGTNLAWLAALPLQPNRVGGPGVCVWQSAPLHSSSSSP